MNISKEERYAIIRRAALKVQKQSKIIKSNKKLAEEVIRLDNDTTNNDVNYETNDAYISAYFSDVISANNQEETL
jgi:hypothetical protein